jgi:regulatory protein
MAQNAIMEVIMIITKLEKVEKSKIRIYIDEEFAFKLSEKELEKLPLEEGQSILPEQYEKLIEVLIYPKAIEKALFILKFMDRCEQELRTKLSREEYPEDIIDRVIEYVKHYGYLNDERFAAAFVKSRKNRKSKMMIRNELQQKGISKDIIQIVFEVEYEAEDMEDAEITAIRKAIAKKTRDPQGLSAEEKQKLIASLYRKGFDLSKIKQNIETFYV